MRKRIGEWLVQAGLVSEADLQLALAEHKVSGERLGAVFARMNLATDEEITRALARQLGFPYVNLAEEAPEASAIALISKEVALKRVCVAMKLEKNLLTVAMSDPLQFSLLQDLEFHTGYRIRQVVATRSGILEALQHRYPDQAIARYAGFGRRRRGIELAAPPGTVGAATSPGAALARAPEEEVFENPEGAPAARPRTDSAPIVDLVDLLVNDAIASRASDVHVEPLEAGVLVRHRLDGILKEVMDLPQWVHEGLVARIKVMAGMDIAEKRLPQDGRLRIKTREAGEVDFRVSTLRTLFGEKVVLRLLDRRKGPPLLEEIGLNSAALQQLRLFMTRQHGMILVVGPTGSGKTTTLCSALYSIRSANRNIITIEDPIEYQIPGINQTQVSEKAKLTFASALRAILRQDPDVILVGEIRDYETARIAMQALQTGHLVLSTLHTDDAPSSVTRLMDMGLEPYVVASALIGVVAQRLVRRLCGHCRLQCTPRPETLRALNIGDVDAATFPFYRAVGCDRCNHTGYHGRVGIYELMHATEKLRRAVAQRMGEDAIREIALASGMITLGEDGLAKAKRGVTTPEEVLRVVTEMKQMRTLCTACGGALSFEFVACPFCGKRSSSGCKSCGRTLQAGWNFCPYCATGTSQKAGGRSRDSKPTAEIPAFTNVAEFKEQP